MTALVAENLEREGLSMIKIRRATFSTYPQANKRKTFYITIDSPYDPT